MSLAFCFVEVKIYISLKQGLGTEQVPKGFVEVKIYISLKLKMQLRPYQEGFVEVKIYISLKRKWKEECSVVRFCRSQNLHISQTFQRTLLALHCFVEVKIYISLKPQIEIWRRNFEFGYKKMDRHRSRPEGNLDKIFIWTWM